MGACQRRTPSPFNHPEAALPRQAHDPGASWTLVQLVSSYVSKLESLQMIHSDQNIHSGLSSLGRKTKVLLQRLSGPYTACSLLFRRRDRQGVPSLSGSAYSAPLSGAFSFWEEIICSENSCFIVLFDWTRLTGPQPPVNMNEGLSCSFKTCLHVDLQRTLFPSEPSKHDPLLSRAIPPSPHWWVSKLLKFPSPDALRRWPELCLALLWIHKVTAGEREEAGRAFIRMYCFTFSIHHQGDDSILVKIHWTPIKSDGCYHWKLKSCQAIIGTNATPRNGGLRASDGLLGIFLVIPDFKISSDHFSLSIFSAVQCASDKIWLCKVEWNNYRQFRCSLETHWFPLPC